MGQPLPVFVSHRPAEWSSSYSVEKMFDGNSSSYWCTPAHPAFPQMLVLQLHAPALVEGIYIDSRIPSYESSSAKDLFVEYAAPSNPGMFMPVGNALVGYAMVTPITFPKPVEASLLRLTILSNYGGNYLGISELQVIGTPTMSQPMMGMAPGMGGPGMAPGMYPQGPGMYNVPAKGMMSPMGSGAYGPGMHVQAQWTDGHYYGATITQFNGSMYEVAWDDGSSPLWVGVHQVKPG